MFHKMVFDPSLNITQSYIVCLHSEPIFMRYEECQSPAFYPSFLRTCGIKLSGWKGVGVKLSLSKGLLARRNKLKGRKGHNIFQKKVQGFDMEW